MYQKAKRYCGEKTAPESVRFESGKCELVEPARTIEIQSAMHFVRAVGFCPVF
ncbi:MAG: hypothetical protein ACR2P7_06675 [bacterium]